MSDSYKDKYYEQRFSDVESDTRDNRKDIRELQKNDTKQDRLIAKLMLGHSEVPAKKDLLPWYRDPALLGVLKILALAVLMLAAAAFLAKGGDINLLGGLFG